MTSIFKWFMIASLFFSFSSVASDCVLLLHGLARTKSAMSAIEKSLDQAGYHVVNIDYPSRKHSIETLAKTYISPALEQCPNKAKVNFVTHSLGGIIVRQYLADYELEKLNHVVMLGPPNHGSEVVDKLKKMPGFKLINGPAALQLGTEKTSVPNTLGSADFSLGIIAGTRAFDIISAQLLPKPNDGKVSVESTKLNGAKEHITLPVTHTFMMRNKKVIRQVLHFLENGEFKKENSKSIR